MSCSCQNQEEVAEEQADNKESFAFVMDVENEEKVKDDIDDVRPGTVA